MIIYMKIVVNRKGPKTKIVILRILKVLTGGESVRRAKHGELKLIFQAILSGVSKHCAGSFPTAEVHAVVEGDDRQI